MVHRRFGTRNDDINRFNFNSYSPLKRGEDGGISVVFGPAQSRAFPASNWLSSAEGKLSSLAFRTYVPKEVVEKGGWFASVIARLQQIDGCLIEATGSGYARCAPAHG